MSYNIKISMVQVGDVSHQEIAEVQTDVVLMDVTESEAEDFFTELCGRAGDMREADNWRALSDEHVHDEGPCCECGSPYHCCCDCPTGRNGDTTGLSVEDKLWLTAKVLQGGRS